MPFNGERLRLLRHFAEQTQRDLADKVAVSQPVITEYEKFRKEPHPDVVEAFAAVFNVHPDFFFEQDSERITEDEFNFRRRVTATDRLKRKVAAQAGLFAIIVQALRRVVGLPPLKMPTIPADSPERIEDAAQQAREFWNLGTDDPISSMTRVLERAGVILTVADPDTAAKVDAFSRYGTTSVVVLNTAKGSTSRTFFDAAHEAAHGVLHFGSPAKSLATRENEADRFAGAFLMPHRAFKRHFWAGGLSWNHLFEMKATWGASIQAIIRRAYDLQLIDAAVYRTTFRQLSRRGWRTDEPEEREPEYPELFQIALDQYCRDTKKTVLAFAEDLHLSPQLFNAVTGIYMKPETGEHVSSLVDYRERKEASK